MSDEPNSEVAPPTDEHTLQRVCRRCSAINSVPGSYCPHCGAPYRRRGPFKKSRARVGSWSRKRKLLSFGVPLLLLLAGAAGGTYLKIEHDNQVRAEREDRAEQRREARAERAQEQQEAAEEDRRLQANLDRLERSVRRETVTGLEKAVTEDAQQSVDDGLLDGPILRTECDPAPGETPMDVSVETAVYDCLAIYKEDADGTASGWTYSGNINFETGRYSWSLGKD